MNIEQINLKIKNAEKRLARIGDAIKRQINRTLVHTVPSSCVNSLGELQGLGTSFDVVCAEIACLIDIRNELEKEND